MPFFIPFLSPPSVPDFLPELQVNTRATLYVGLNVTLTCRTFLSALDVSATLEFSGPNGSIAIDGSAGRIRLTDIVSDVDTGFGFTRFSRNLNFVPISAGDAGMYTCTGTVMPTMPNPLVINRMETDQRDITVFGESLLGGGACWGHPKATS